MKKEVFIAIIVMLAVFTGCADHDELVDNDTSDMPVAVNLAFSMPTASKSMTRMADSVVQTTPDCYRGLKEVRIIPFKVTGLIGSDNLPFVYDVAGGDESGRVSGKPSALTPSAYYYYPDCPFWSGTTSVLFYARGANSVKVGGDAIPATDKTYYGSTVTNYMDVSSPAQIQFSPEQILQTTDVHSRAQALADYLTAIASTTGWSVSEDPKLKALYKDFIHQDDNRNNAVIGGSSACVRAFVEELYREAGKQETADAAATAVAAAIRNNIQAGASVDDQGKVTLTNWNGTELTGYPAVIGLPDGAAALKWNGKAFESHTQTSVETSITSLDHFAYPAELSYYGNSTIKTSSEDVDKTVYQNATTWSEVLGNYKAGTVITSATKSAAMVSPVQYGVAQLSVRLKQVVAAPFLDANGDIVSFADNYYPLTAVIVGGQYPVGFDFRPETVQSWPEGETESEKMTDKMLFVYDPQVKTDKSAGTAGYYCLSSSGDTGTANTLVLQTYEKKNVRVVLEFENRSDKKFMGHDGIVYPGTKFYLLGEVNPATGTNTSTDSKNRVFTQDFTTTFDVQVESFEGAYNVMPDLLAPRMEIGVKVVNWETIRPTTVELQK